jgi:type IV secretory pathway TraG/TraD family ATPase VirD4
VSSSTSSRRGVQGLDDVIGGDLGGDLWTDLVLLAAAGGGLVTAVALVVWLAGSLLWWAIGHRAGPGLGEVVRALAGGGDLPALWPGLPVPAVLTFAGLMLLAVAAACVVAVRRWLDAHPPRVGYARAGQFAELLPGRVGRAKARCLRSTLRTRGRVLPQDLGVPLGRLRPHGPILRASWEDVVLAICAPRSGKTTSLAVPAILDAPGPVVATSNKADLLPLTRALRAADTGQQVWTFDPQQITPDPQFFAWDALAGVHTVADARRLAGHFIQEIRRHADSGDFWDRDAEDLLTGLLLAAALDGAGLAQVGRWLTAISAVAPQNILRENGFGQLADSMAGRSGGAEETREGVYATARAAAACLSDPVIMSRVTPREGMDTFDPARFARSRQTLYLLSKDGAGSAAPLVAAFADRVMLEAVRAAEASPGGRLDPPMLAVLDEAANICRITELPRLYSHLGSRGVVPMTILQSRTQGRRVWGEAGMDELFGAATVKVIGAGIDDPAFAEDLSRLIGEHDVTVKTRGSGGTSRTTRRERVLPVDKVRALPKHTALLLVTGVRPGRLRFVPWMAGPRAADIRSTSRSEATS